MVERMPPAFAGMANPPLNAAPGSSLPPAAGRFTGPMAELARLLGESDVAWWDETARRSDGWEQVVFVGTGADGLPVHVSVVYGRTPLMDWLPDPTPCDALGLPGVTSYGWPGQVEAYDGRDAEPMGPADVVERWARR